MGDSGAETLYAAQLVFSNRSAAFAYSSFAREPIFCIADEASESNPLALYG